MSDINVCNVMSKSFKYFVLGMGVAVVSYTLPKNKIDMDNILMIAISASLIYGILDMTYTEKYD